MSKRFLYLVLACASLSAHDVITTKITWNREIIRILQDRCLSCHRNGGSAFSLEKYEQGRPWAKAIQEEVLERRMPPWGAVKGFGDFRNDRALTPEQIEVIADWVEGGAPEGEPGDLPKPEPSKPKRTPAASAPHQRKLTVSGEYKIARPLLLTALQPVTVAPGSTFQVTAQLPDSTVVPLLWLQPFKPAYGHLFVLRNPLRLPAGTVLHGIPASATLALY
jgi:hypothetical protein